MKRFFLVLMVVAFATTLGFTQELKFDGYINAGIGLGSSEYTPGGDMEHGLKMHAIEAEQNGLRFRLNGSYTNAAKNAGAKFRMQAQSSIANGYLSLPYVFGWVGFMDNVLNLSAGIVEDGTWTTGDWWLFANSVSDFAGLGTLLKISPLDDMLVIGLGAYVSGRTGGGRNNQIEAYNEIRDLWQWNDDYEAARYTAHVLFNMEDLLRFALSYKTKAGFGNDYFPNSDLFLDLRFLAVENLTAVVAAQITHLGDKFGDKGEIKISESIGYKMDDLGFGFNAVQFFKNESRPNPDPDPSLLFNLWGSYAMGDLVPRIDLVYFMGGRSNFVDYDGNDPSFTWFRRAFTPLYDDDRSLLSIRPSIKINLDARTHLEIGDMLNFDSYKNIPGSKNDTLISNVFYIDLKWSF